MRNESSTAIFSHWWVTQPDGDFSATRRRPESRPASACSIAARTSAGAEAGLRFARSSHARSMVDLALSITVSEIRGEPCDAGKGLDALRKRCDEGDPDVALAGIPAACLAREIAAGKDEHIIVTVQSAG